MEVSYEKNFNIFLIFCFLVPTDKVFAYDISVYPNAKITRMWIEKKPVYGVTSPTYYYRNGNWHGYLQLVQVIPGMFENPTVAYYSGYVYPISSSIPKPTRMINNY